MKCSGDKESVQKWRVVENERAERRYRMRDGDSGVGSWCTVLEEEFLRKVESIRLNENSV